ncbi:hypothetical protein ACFSJ3_16665 [Corallincola platygyrae]|uniref:MSHA biogenesis protein MshP n=1 Tax=Corallincola platygyrae TaxID=1193278 RepID=A0ABW4XRA7_9GAMM
MFLSSKRSPLKRQHGSALLLALFIVIVLVILGGAMTRILGSSSESVTYEVYGVRAMQAAQAGAEAGLATLFTPGAADLHCDGQLTSVTDDDFSSSTIFPALNLSGVEGLENCSVVEVQCADLKHQGITYYHIISTATCTVGGGSTALVISRQVEVEAKSL